MSGFISIANTGRNHWLYYLLSLGAVFLAYALGQAPLILVLRARVEEGIITNQQASAFFDDIDFTSLGIPSHIGLLLLLGSAICALIALYMCVTFIHKRSFISSITSRTAVDWQKVLFAFFLWFILTIFAELVMYLQSPEVYVWTFNWRKWVPLLFVSVAFVPLQTSFEEILTRGYLLQGIGLATRSPVAAILLTSVIFAVMHLGNPEIRAFGTGIMVVYYFSVALFLAILTVIDGGLEYALGIHAATNVYGASFVSFSGSVLQTDTLIRANEISPVWMLFLFYGMMAIFVMVAMRIYRPSGIGTLFQRIDAVVHTEIPNTDEVQSRSDL